MVYRLTGRPVQIERQESRPAYSCLFWPMASTLAAIAAGGKDSGLSMRVRIGLSVTNEDGGDCLSRVQVDRAWPVFDG